MPPLYLTEQGAKLHIDNRRVTVSAPRSGGAPCSGDARDDGENETLASVPLIHVSEVVVLGNVSITTPAMKTLLAENIDVVFLTIDGAYCGRLIGPGTPHVLLRRKQYQRQASADFSLTMAKHFVRAKLEHLRAMLQRHQRKNFGRRMADGGFQVENPKSETRDLESAINAISVGLTRGERATALSSLLGIEGAASAAYFGGLKQLLKPEWKFEKRLRRPPPDPINVLLSFGYTLLTHAAEGAVGAVGLDVYAGFLHQTEYNRPSLALDLVEEFRPLIDGVVMWATNSSQITPADFTLGTDPDRPVVMSDRARKIFIQAYERRMNETFTHPKLNQALPIRQCLLAQARQIAEAVQADRPGFIPMGFR